MKKFTYKQYTVVPSQKGIAFDLLISVVRQKLGTGTKQDPNGETYEGQEIISHDMPFEYVCDRIISIETAKGESVEPITSLLQEYKKEKQELLTYIKSIKNQL